jgi:transcriptional regulator GlxA family with amidase domain
MTGLKVCMPVYDQVNLLDVAGAMEMLSWAHIETVVVAQQPGKLRFTAGLAFFVERDFDQVGACDAIWVPGGDPGALQAIIEDPSETYLNFLRAMQKKVRITASVCDGALLLAAAGLLDGYEATTHWQFIPCFAQYFPNVKIVPGHPRFHLDRDRLTGAGMSSGLDEALKLIELLTGDKSAADNVRLTTQYFPKAVPTRIPTAVDCPVPLKSRKTNIRG